jgi:hypothetical protein
MRDPECKRVMLDVAETYETFASRERETKEQPLDASGGKPARGWSRSRRFAQRCPFPSKMGGAEAVANFIETLQRM